MGAVGEQEVGGRIEARFLEEIQLLKQRDRVHHAPVAHDGLNARVEDGRGEDVEDDRPAAHDDRVPGVVAAAVAHHGVEPRGEQVHELTLALVTPLGADDRESGHRGADASDYSSSPSSRRTSLSSRAGVRSGLNPRCWVRTMPSRSAM